MKINLIHPTVKANDYHIYTEQTGGYVPRVGEKISFPGEGRFATVFEVSFNIINFGMEICEVNVYTEFK